MLGGNSMHQVAHKKREAEEPPGSAACGKRQILAPDHVTGRAGMLPQRLSGQSSCSGVSLSAACDQAAHQDSRQSAQGSQGLMQAADSSAPAKLGLQLNGLVPPGSRLVCAIPVRDAPMSMGVVLETRQQQGHSTDSKDSSCVLWSGLFVSSPRRQLLGVRPFTQLEEATKHCGALVEVANALLPSSGPCEQLQEPGGLPAPQTKPVSVPQTAHAHPATGGLQTDLDASEQSADARWATLVQAAWQAAHQQPTTPRTPHTSSPAHQQSAPAGGVAKQSIAVPAPNHWHPAAGPAADKLSVDVPPPQVLSVCTKRGVPTVAVPSPTNTPMNLPYDQQPFSLGVAHHVQPARGYLSVARQLGQAEPADGITQQVHGKGRHVPERLAQAMQPQMAAAHGVNLAVLHPTPMQMSLVQAPMLQQGGRPQYVLVYRP